MKKRIQISNLLVLLLLIFSRPDSKMLFLIGLFFILLGFIIRLISSFSITKSEELTINGIYSVSRNPLYLGTLTITFGLIFQLSSISNLIYNLIIWSIIVISFSIIYYKTIKAEEKFLSERYKEKFDKYLKEVPCLLPNIFKIKEIFNFKYYNIERFKKNKEYRGFLGIIFIEIIILLKLKYGF